MHRVNVSLHAVALTFLIFGLWWGPYALSAKEERPGSSGIPPEKVAAYVYAVVKADRTVYTKEIVNRLQEKGVTTASEHWEQEGTLMLPAQFLQHSGKLAAEGGSGVRYRLISLWPIYRRNAPASDLEHNALESLGKNPDLPVTGIVTSGRKQFFPGHLSRHRRLTGLYQLSQRSSAQPETGLQAQRCDGWDRHHHSAGIGLSREQGGWPRAGFRKTMWASENFGGRPVAREPDRSCAQGSQHTVRGSERAETPGRSARGGTEGERRPRW